MRYDLSKYERGQVWVIRNKQVSTSVGHEQQKDRPWLILSIGKFNNSSGMVTCVPITTRDSVRSPAQVLFTNDRGQSNIILCEQIKTFDHSSGAYIFDYMGQLSDEIMEKVDVALSTHLGMHYSPITLNKLYDSMEAIIKSVGYMQDKASTPKFTDQDVLDFAEKLQVLTQTAQHESSRCLSEENNDDDIQDSLTQPYLKTSTEESPEPSIMKPYYVSPLNPPNRTVHTIYADDENEETKSEKAPRIKWTAEKCEEFLEDDRNLPMKAVMEKWGISKKTRYYSMKNYVQSLLKKMTKS